MSDQSIVFTKLVADDCLRPGPGSQAFVTTHCHLWCILKRMGGKIIWRQGRPVFVIPLSIFLWRIPRIMGSHESNIQKEGFVRFGAFNERHRFICEDCTGEASRIPFRSQLSSIQILHLKVCMICHPSHVNSPPIGKGLIQRPLPVVPFAHDESFIIRLLQKQGWQCYGIAPIRVWSLSR